MVEGWVPEPDSDGRDVDSSFVDELSFDAPMDVKQLIEPWVQLWCW